MESKRFAFQMNDFTLNLSQIFLLLFLKIVVKTCQNANTLASQAIYTEFISDLFINFAQLYLYL